MAQMAEQTPFIKQLAASDKPTRDKALDSLRLYLTSGRAFTYIELLKIWKGLFYCIFHTANPLPQQRLSNSLASFLLALPNHVFIPYLAAFFQTMITNWTAIPSLRLDKYLYLIRVMVSHSFIYMSRVSWRQDLLDAWTALIQGQGDCDGALDVKNAKVGDGLRYHLLDVWVDGLIEVESWKAGVEKGVLSPIRVVAAEGSSKVLRDRAKSVLEDERLHEGEEKRPGEDVVDDSGDEFDGFGQ